MCCLCCHLPAAQPTQLLAQTLHGSAELAGALRRHINAQGFLAAAASRMAAIEDLDLSSARFGNDPFFRLHFRDLPSLRELTLLEACLAQMLQS